MSKQFQSVTDNEDSSPVLTICQSKQENNDIRSDTRWEVECDEQGRFMRRQCDSGRSVCWCVRPDTGNLIDGTMTTDGSQPDCDGREEGETRQMKECEKRFEK